MKTKIIKIKAGEDIRPYIDEAAAVLRAGGLVAFPTETVYGLGADALDERAVGMIYGVKGRPADNPLIIHIAEPGMLDALVADRDELAETLMRLFWPGPLTLVFRRQPGLPDFATASLDTVAVRMPSHPIAAQLLEAAGIPIAAPSANLSGKPSPTRGEHVIDDLSGKIDMIIDAGRVSIGLESTVLDVTSLPFAILRPGGVTYEMLAEAIGEKNVTSASGVSDTTGAVGAVSVTSATDTASAAGAADMACVTRASGTANVPDVANNAAGLPSTAASRSPGVKYRHYAPNASMTLLKGKSDNVAFWLDLLSDGKKTGLLASDELLESLRPEMADKFCLLPLGSIDKPETAVGRFYGALRESDDLRVERIYCELYARRGIGAALADRMLRAAGGNVINADEPVVLFVCTGNTCRSAMAEALFNSAVRDLAQNAHTADAIDSADAVDSADAADAVYMTNAPISTDTAFTASADAASFGAASSKPRAVSAGVFADEDAPATPESVAAMARYGIDLTPHRARRLDESALRGASVVLTMTAAHKEEIKRRFPAYPQERLYTLVELMNKLHSHPTSGGFITQTADICDPYGLGRAKYEECAERLHHIVSSLARILSRVS